MHRVLIVGYARDSRIFYIWNWQTNEKMGEHRMLGEYRSKVAKFVAQKQCVVIGGDYGSILVGTCPTLDHFTQFRAHPANVTALAVHPTWPFLLSSCNNPSVKLWNWSHGWSCENVYEVNASMRKIRKIMFHPTHARAFMTVHENGSAMVCLPTMLTLIFRLYLLSYVDYCLILICLEEHMYIPF